MWKPIFFSCHIRMAPATETAYKTAFTKKNKGLPSVIISSPGSLNRVAKSVAIATNCSKNAPTKILEIKVRPPLINVRMQSIVSRFGLVTGGGPGAGPGVLSSSSILLIR